LFTKAIVGKRSRALLKHFLVASVTIEYNGYILVGTAA